MSYLALVRRLPPPTPEQAERFARAMAQRHSWYKHLPVWPPAPFRFYIAPDAPQTSVPGGRLLDRRYAHVRDAETHERQFGFWACVAPYQGMGGLSPELRAEVLRAEGATIPREILDVGVAWINAFIDPRAPRCRFQWEPFERRLDAYGLVPYLQHLGHDATVETAAEIAREVITEEHVTAGRTAMLEEMVATMARVHALIWSS